MENETKNELITEWQDLIAVFMGYTPVTIGYYGTDDSTVWQEANKDWLEKPEIVSQYDNSVGDYFVNIDRNEIIPRDDIDYFTNWNDLIPACHKWDSLEFADWDSSRKKRYMQLCDQLDQFVSCYEIIPVFLQLVRNIEWYNKTQSRGGGN